MSNSITYYMHQIEIDVFSPFGKDLTAVETFANTLKAYTAAQIQEVSYTQGSQLLLSGTVAEADAYPLRTYAKILMKRAADGKTYGLLIYAPKKDMFEVQYSEEKSKYKVKEAIGIALAAEFSTMAGETFTYSRGWLYGETYGE